MTAITTKKRDVAHEVQTSSGEIHMDGDTWLMLRGSLAMESVRDSLEINFPSDDGELDLL